MYQIYSNSHERRGEMESEREIRWYGGWARERGGEVGES